MSNAELAVPPQLELQLLQTGSFVLPAQQVQLQPVQENDLVLPAQQPQVAAPGSPAKAGGGSPPPAEPRIPQPEVNFPFQQNVVHETLMLQQNIVQDGFSWQDTQEAIETIKEVAEWRHQEVPAWN